MIVPDPFSITECSLAVVGERHVTCGIWEQRGVRQRVGKSIDSQVLRNIAPATGQLSGMQLCGVLR